MSGRLRPVLVHVWCLACLRIGTAPTNEPERLRVRPCPKCGSRDLVRCGRRVAAKLRELYQDPAWRDATRRLARTRHRQPSLPA